MMLLPQAVWVSCGCHAQWQKRAVGTLTILRDTGSSSYSMKDMAGSLSKCFAVKAPLRSIFLGKGPCSRQPHA